VESYIARTTRSQWVEQRKSLNGVSIGISFAKWGKPEEFLLNWVITVTTDKLGGKKWNLLKFFFYHSGIELFCTRTFPIVLSAQ
jgi:hypothetical protein